MPRVIASIILSLFCLTSAHAQGEAKLREGDSLTLVFRGIPDAEQASLNGNYRIDDAGLLKLPYITPFKVAGLTPSQGEREIEKRFVAGEIFVNPAVTIDAGGTSRVRTVTVMGEVQSQGSLPYDDKLTVIAAIGNAKGFSDFADKRKVKLVRDERAMILDLTRADSEQARMKMLPGDVLVVKQRGFGGR